MKITKDTPFEEVTGRREQVMLLQAVVDCVDAQFVKGITQFNKRPWVGIVVAAERAGYFKYSQLLIETAAGKSYPSAQITLNAIEAAEAGELTEDSKEWKAVVRSVGLDDESRTRSGKKIEGSSHLFELVTGEAPSSSSSKKRTSSPKKAVERKVVEEEPIEEAASVGSSERLDNGDLIDAMASAFGALDQRLTERLDLIERGGKRRGEELRAVFSVLGLIGKVLQTVYLRQEQLDFAVDPAGEFPILDDDTLASLDFFTQSEAATNPAPREEEAEEEDEEEDEEGEEEDEEGEEEEEEEEGDSEAVSITAEMESMTDEDFDAMLEDALDIILDEPQETLRVLSATKLKSIASRVGVPGANGISLKSLLIAKIMRAMSSVPD